MRSIAVALNFAKWRACFLLSVLAICASYSNAQIVQNSQNFSVAIQQHALNSAVKITISGEMQDEEGVWGDRTKSSSGTVVGMDKDCCYILTSSHGTDPFTEDHICWVTFYGVDRPLPGYVKKEIIARNRVADIALLKLYGNSLVNEMMPICPKGKMTTKSRYPALTVGCSEGNDPTCETGWVLETSQAKSSYSEGLFSVSEFQPATGRSGGQKVINPGYQVGTIVWGSEKKNTGGHSLLSSIHKLCDKANCSWLYSEEYTSKDEFWVWNNSLVQQDKAISSQGNFQNNSPSFVYPEMFIPGTQPSLHQNCVGGT